MDSINSANRAPTQQLKICDEDPLSLELLVNRIEDKDSIINGISDAIMLLDTKTYKILEVNQAFLDSYKTSPDKILGKTCYEITHHRSEACPDVTGSTCPLRQTVLKGQIARTEHIHKDAEGNKIYFEIASYPVRDSHGEISRIVHLSRDVTDRRRAEEALKEQVTRSEHLAALGQAVAEITHEIRNPLMLIGGLARQILHSPNAETKSEKLTIITKEVARLEKLLTDLGEYYLPKTASHEAISVRVLLEKINLLVKDECARRGVRSELRVDGTDLVVDWDPHKLEQVFLNVIKNSLEAMENGGNLSIDARSSGDKVEVTITDDGCGIPKKHMDKIMKCFFTTKSYGTGLGLCISKKYVDEHEGSSFSVESEEAKGTTVKINLS
jgi:PAS domain S-box-containing protein